MARPMFTPEELEELRRFDEELDEEFVQTQEEIVESRKRDRAAVVAGMEPEKRKIAEYQAAYYEANRDKIAEYQAAYREANRDKIAEYQAAYREANRDAYNAYMREYQRRRREAKRGKRGGLPSQGVAGGTPSVGEADSSPREGAKGSSVSGEGMKKPLPGVRDRKAV